jgi:hypothetical protein
MEQAVEMECQMTWANESVIVFQLKHLHVACVVLMAVTRNYVIFRLSCHLIRENPVFQSNMYLHVRDWSVNQAGSKQAILVTAFMAYPLTTTMEAIYSWNTGTVLPDYTI